jgi:hypothetical protein
MKISIKFLNELMVKNNIPETATLQSDSGWECCASDCESVYYNPKKNTIILCGYRNGLHNRTGCIQLFAENYTSETDGIFKYIVDSETKEVYEERVYNN